MNAKPSSVDEYLAGLPEDVRRTLESVRRAVLAAVPDAVESIGYGMPAYKYRGRPLVYFAAAKNHWALYGTAEGTIRFPKDMLPEEGRLERLLSARIAEIDGGSR